MWFLLRKWWDIFFWNGLWAAHTFHWLLVSSWHGWGFFSLYDLVEDASCRWKEKQSKQFLLSDWIILVCGMTSLWKVPLIWSGKVDSGIKKLSSLRTCWTWICFSGAGSLISSAVDINRWARGSDYITYKRASISDLWGSPKSRKESWLFCWSHHWWEGLSFCPRAYFFYSIPYVGALSQLTGKSGRFILIDRLAL